MPRLNFRPANCLRNASIYRLPITDREPIRRNSDVTGLSIFLGEENSISSVGYRVSAYHCFVASQTSLWLNQYCGQCALTVVKADTPVRKTPFWTEQFGRAWRWVASTSTTEHSWGRHSKVPHRPTEWENYWSLCGEPTFKSGMSIYMIKKLRENAVWNLLNWEGGFSSYLSNSPLTSFILIKY